MSRLSAVVLYDGLIKEAEEGVIFESDHYIPLTLKRNITIEELITKISLKIRVAGQRRLSSLQYRFPTELFPLTYTSFQFSNDDDVSMMVDAHMGSSQSLIEMYVTFIEVCVTRGLSYYSHFGIEYQTDQVDSPTQQICNDFTSLMVDPTPDTMPSSSIGRHSSATAYDLNPRGFTNNPYDNISSTSRGRHSSANVFDLHMEMPTRRQSIHIPHDTMASSSRGGHASGNLFDLNIGLSEEPSSPPEEPLREPGADGAETGLFVEPDSPQFNVHSDDDKDDVPINTTPAKLPAHMYEADYDAMYEPEFPDLPDVGNYGLQSSVNDGNLHIGMEFASKEEAMMAIKSYNIRNSVQSRVDRSNTEKYVCYCVQRDNGCQWMVRVSKRKRKNNLWELTRYNGPHTYCATGINQDHPNLDSNIICQAIMPIVKQSSHIAVAVLISAIQSQYGYTVSYKKAWLAKQNAICKLHGEWDSSYNELPSWFYVVQRLNPGTIVEFETQHHYVNDRMVRDRCQFYRVFWTYPQCINAVKYYKPVVQIDGTFSYGKHKQVLLLAVVQDGNRNILPVAFALVQGEDTESWAFFLKNLRLHVITRERVCIISDRGAGIKAAMDSLGTMYRPPHVQHRYCVRLIAANYYGKYKKNDERQLVVRMGYELLPQRFESMLQELFGKNKKGCEYIMDISKEMWTNAYDGGELCMRQLVALVRVANIRPFKYVVDDSAKYFAITEAVGSVDASLGIKLGIHLWGGSVLNLGTKKHRDKYFEGIDNVDYPGCFAMTELHHGSNVQGLQTTATFDPITDEFIIDTPNDGAIKWWIGNAAVHGKFASVFAKLIIPTHDSTKVSDMGVGGLALHILQLVSSRFRSLLRFGTRHKLMPILASAYAFHIAAENLVEKYSEMKKTHDEQLVADVHALSAGLKSYVTSFTAKSLRTCREACGGHGYAAVNRFGSLRNDHDIFQTFEGDNTVLLQQFSFIRFNLEFAFQFKLHEAFYCDLYVAADLLKQYKDKFQGGKLSVTWNYLRESMNTYLSQPNPIIARWESTDHLRDPKFQLDAFRYRTSRLLHSAAARLQKHSKTLGSFGAWNRCLDHLLTLAESHIESVILASFIEAVQNCPDPSIQAALKLVCYLYALDRIWNDIGTYRNVDYVAPNKAKAIHKLTEYLCFQVRNIAGELIDAFDIPASVTRAPIAMQSEAYAPDVEPFSIQHVYFVPLNDLVLTDSALKYILNDSEPSSNNMSHSELIHTESLNHSLALNHSEINKQPLNQL
ncbi:Acyl-coenzyme A oxidase, peroxisomal [Hibiscus syriacus]|uniref:acyl-CoA oxidase n=1 Tax=Hibiscus syriacus TaxID=106335 RepID=A0A6A2Y0G3_HIBSY|nr:Acyl-coenzyme A oxidase, peroxisomal [Hibiscus syriacus]